MKHLAYFIRRFNLKSLTASLALALGAVLKSSVLVAPLLFGPSVDLGGVGVGLPPDFFVPSVDVDCVALSDPS
jgi:hypothetical protein